MRSDPTHTTAPGDDPIPGDSTAPPRRDEQTVTKANESIAIRPKRGKLTLLSRRIYNALLYHAQRAGVDQPGYTIALAELIDDARFNSNNTELLKTHIRDMQATTIEWHTSIGEQRRWTSTQLLGTVHIHEPGRGSPCTISWSYPEPIRERLLKPAHYTRIFLEISSQMRTYAASVLYELGSRYLTSPGRLTMREDLVWWASVLTGRSDIQQVDYRILHRDTIKKALVELDTLNDGFRMEVVEHKRGRKVEELQFRVIPKAQPSLTGLDGGAKNVFDLQLVERLVALGFKRPDAQDLYAATDEGELRAALELVAQRQKNSALPALDSPAAYLRDALKKGYASRHASAHAAAAVSAAPAGPSGRAHPALGASAAQPPHPPDAPTPAAPVGSAGSSGPNASNGPVAADSAGPGTGRSSPGRGSRATRGSPAAPAAPLPEAPSLQERLHRLRDEWDHEQGQRARAHVEALTDAERQPWVQRFEAQRLADLPSPIAAAWRRDGLASRIAAGSFYRWLAGQLWPEPVTDSMLLAFALSRGDAGLR